MGKFIQVLTSAGTKEDAQKIAQSVVEKRLAGCAQVVGPITSTYRWDGKLETAEEWLCIIKSRNDLYKELEKAIQQIHPYKVPEILAVPVVEGSQSYLEWLDGELRKSGD
ncbi:MAG: putative divalent ion tolerance protein [Dehalococcoidia bacterium]|nr:putative divalent ion tolerance protein [Dehalococcoidia bacterium]MBF8303697.1 putative divalent ion tolerance protein [Dehalococcoidia bacterium]